MPFLKKVEREHTQFVTIALVLASSPCLPKKIVVGAVPLFDDVEALVDLAAQSRLVQETGPGIRS